MSKPSVMSAAKKMPCVNALRRIDMAKYTVHFMGYYGYDVTVEAGNEEEAKEKARPIFEDADPSDFFFESNGTDVWEEK